MTCVLAAPCSDGTARPPQPKSKREMYMLYERGSFGNKLRTWPSVDALLASDYGGLVTLRYAGSAGGGFAAYEVPVANVEQTIRRWDGADRALVKVNESAPDEHLVFQGEVAASPFGGGLIVRGSRAKAKMRDAMKSALLYTGVRASLVLHKYLTAGSADDIYELLAIYPECVVEFSAYSVCLGSCRGRNAVVWEVRAY